MRNGKRSKSNLKLLPLLLFVLSEICFAQQFPGWFLDQGDISCNNLTVGYARRSYYGDTTAVKNALLNAAENYVKLSKINIAGDQNFWATAIGNAWMGSSFKETYDSSRISKVSEEIKIIDIYKLNDYLIVLASNDEYELLEIEKNLISISELKKPNWLETLPEDDAYIYAIGSSESYHYLETSWLTAEKNARLVLARSLNSKTKSVQKFSSTEDQVISNESTSLEINNIELFNRWIDLKSKVFYILIRCRKFN